jgi:hypothetical protein
MGCNYLKLEHTAVVRIKIVLKGKESNIKENREKNERSKWLGMK